MARSRTFKKAASKDGLGNNLHAKDALGKEKLTDRSLGTILVALVMDLHHELEDSSRLRSAASESGICTRIQAMVNAMTDVVATMKTRIYKSIPEGNLISVNNLLHEDWQTPLSCCIDMGILSLLAVALVKFDSKDMILSVSGIAGDLVALTATVRQDAGFKLLSRFLDHMDESHILDHVARSLHSGARANSNVGPQNQESTRDDSTRTTSKRLLINGIVSTATVIDQRTDVKMATKRCMLARLARCLLHRACPRFMLLSMVTPPLKLMLHAREQALEEPHKLEESNRIQWAAAMLLPRVLYYSLLDVKTPADLLGCPEVNAGFWIAVLNFIKNRASCLILISKSRSNSTTLNSSSEDIAWLKFVIQICDICLVLLLKLSEEGRHKRPGL
jgi:hypothetical protein